MLFTLASLLPLLVAVSAIPIDNGIIGEPEVQCGPTSIQFSFSSQNPFVGMVYAKNHHNEEGCFAAGENNAGGGIEIPFEACNVRRIRSLEPRGVFVTATLVVQFHGAVITKVDRAFHLRCFYMEADKTVDAELEVSMLTTELRTFQVPMPVCRYEILDAETLSPIRFVTIGDKIIHKWTCDTETVDTFCMEVYGCYVDDAGAPESRIDLIDEEGCSLDGNLVPNVEYVADLMGEAPSHVFKYADRPQLYFNCQIRIGVKEPNGDCFDFRGSACPEPGFSTGRRKRSLGEEPARVVRPRQVLVHVENLAYPVFAVGFLDVTPTAPVYVADVELARNDIPERLRGVLNNSEEVVNAPEDCVSLGYLSGGVILLAVLVVAVAVLSAKLCLGSKRY